LPGFGGVRLNGELTNCGFRGSVRLPSGMIQRSAVGKRLNKLKTEYSQDEVPIERGFILELKKWQALCVDSEGRWLFPTNRELTALVNTLPLARTYAFGWQGGSATRVNIPSSNSFEVGTTTGVVQVNRGVLSLESVP
jgi:hypothetical protein